MLYKKHTGISSKISTHERFFSLNLTNKKKRKELRLNLQLMNKNNYKDKQNGLTFLH